MGDPDIEKIKAKRDVKGLIKALRNKKADIRSKAAQALGEIRDARAIEPLLTSLRDGDRNMRWQAGEALEKLGWVPKNEVERITSLVAMRRWDELVNAQEPSIRALLTAYEKADWRLFPYPLAALWEIGKPAVPTLVDTIKDKSAHRAARVLSGQALGGIDDTRGIEALVAFYIDENENKDHREVVGVALELQGERALAPMMSALTSGELIFDVFAQTATILGHIGKPAVKGLIDALRDERKGVYVPATLALFATGDPKAVDALRSEPPEKDALLKGDIALFLEHFTPLSIERLLLNIKNTDVTIRKIATIALGNTGDCRAVEPLTLAARSDTDEGIRLSASFSLGKLINCLGVRDTLLQMLAADNETMRVLATFGLRASGASVLHYL